MLFYRHTAAGGNIRKVRSMAKEFAKPFYNSKRWKRKRKLILRRDGYKCQEAKLYGQHEEATTVHHIYPLEDYPELAYTDWNLISVSGSRHDAFHDRATGKLTDRGRYWQNKRRKEFEEWEKGNACMVQKLRV